MDTVREMARALLHAEDDFFNSLPRGWLRRLVPDGSDADRKHVALLNAQTELMRALREIVL